MKFKLVLTIFMLALILLTTACDGCDDAAKRFHNAAKQDMEKVSSELEAAKYDRKNLSAGNIDIVITKVKDLKNLRNETKAEILTLLTSILKNKR